MTSEERESLETANVKDSQTRDLLDRHAAQSVAISHLFERSSIARELHAAAMLLRRGLGEVSVAEALDFIRRDRRLLRPFPESRFLTTREAMQEESDMLKIVEAGRGKFEEIGNGKSWKPAADAAAINDEQAAAVARPGDGRSRRCRIRQDDNAGSGRSCDRRSFGAGRYGFRAKRERNRNLAKARVYERGNSAEALGRSRAPAAGKRQNPPCRRGRLPFGPGNAKAVKFRRWQ
jgi:hypothetical protein